MERLNVKYHINDKREGVEKWYDENKNLLCEVSQKNSKVDGVEKYYTGSGKLLAKYVSK